MITQNNKRNTRNSNTSASQLYPARVIQTQPSTYRNCESHRVVARCSPMPVVLTNGHSSEQHFPRRQFISQFHKPSCIFNRHGRFLWCGEIRRWPRHLVQCLSASNHTSANKINSSPTQCSTYQCMCLILTLLGPAYLNVSKDQGGGHIVPPLNILRLGGEGFQFILEMTCLGLICLICHIHFKRIRKVWMP